MGELWAGHWVGGKKWSLPTEGAIRMMGKTGELQTESKGTWAWSGTVLDTPRHGMLGKHPWKRKQRFRASQKGLRCAEQR